MKNSRKRTLSALMAMLMLFSLLPMSAAALTNANNSDGLFCLVEDFEAQSEGNVDWDSFTIDSSTKIQQHWQGTEEYSYVTNEIASDNGSRVLKSTASKTHVLDDGTTVLDGTFGGVFTVKFPDIVAKGGVWELSFDYKQSDLSSDYTYLLSAFGNLGGYYKPCYNKIGYGSSYTQYSVSPLLTDWVRITHVVDFNAGTYTLKAKALNVDGADWVTLDGSENLTSKVMTSATTITEWNLYSLYVSRGSQSDPKNDSTTGVNLINASCYYDNIRVEQVAAKKIDPEVTSSVADGTAGVALDSELTLSFNQAMQADTLSGITLKEKATGASVAVQVKSDDTKTVTVAPTDILKGLTEYELTVPATVKTKDGQNMTETSFSFATTALPEFYLHENFNTMGNLINAGQVGDYFNKVSKGGKDFRFLLVKTQETGSNQVWLYDTASYNSSYTNENFRVQVTSENGQLKIVNSGVQNSKNHFLRIEYPGAADVSKDTAVNTKASISTIEKVKMDVTSDKWNNFMFYTSDGATSVMGYSGLKISDAAGYNGTEKTIGTFDGKKHTLEVVTDYQANKKWAYWDGVKTEVIDIAANKSTNGKLNFYIYDTTEETLYLDNLSVSELARPEVQEIGTVKSGNSLVLTFNTPIEAIPEGLTVKDSSGNAVNGNWTADATKSKWTFSGTLTTGSYTVTVPTTVTSLDGVSPLEEKTATFAVAADVKDITADYKILDVNGAELTALPASGSINITADVRNNSGEAKTPFIGAALYDSEGKLLRLAYSNETIPAIGKVINFKVSAEGAAKLKIFTWSDLTGLQPLAESKTIEN